MNETNEAADKLRRIQQLWKEQEQAKPGTREHEALIEKIRVLAAEYQVLVDEAKNRAKRK